jgi:tetratricopeptide (TPR) repeat protein
MNAQPESGSTLSQYEISSSYKRLAELAAESGQADSAVQLYQRALNMGVQLNEAEPRNVIYKRDLGNSYVRLAEIAADSGETDRAIELYDQALKIAEALPDIDPHYAASYGDFGISYEKLADLAEMAGNTAQIGRALQLCERALIIAESMAEAEPGNVVYQRNLGVFYERLADLAVQSRQSERALQLYERTLASAKALAQVEPGNAAYQRDLAVSYDKLGDLARLSSQETRARQLYELSLTITESLAEAEPTNIAYQRDLAVSYNKLADLARQLYEQSLGLGQQLAVTQPSLTRRYETLLYGDVLASELSVCRKRGLERLDVRSHNQNAVAAPELERLASHYCSVRYPEIRGRIAQIKRLLRDALDAMARQNQPDADLIRDLFFGDSSQIVRKSSGELLDLARKKSGESEVRFRARRNAAMADFAVFLADFTTKPDPRLSLSDDPRQGIREAVAGVADDGSERFVDLLAAAANVTIIGLTNANLALTLEKALRRKRATSGQPEAFWNSIRVVFLKEDLLSGIVDEGHTTSRGRDESRQLQAKAAYGRRAVSSFLRQESSARWAVYETPTYPPFMGSMFEIPDGRRVAHILIRRPHSIGPDQIYVEIDASQHRYFSTSFEEVIQASAESKFFPIREPESGVFTGLAGEESTTSPELITALDLNQWASSLDAQSMLPILIRRLILATASVTELSMRGRDGVGLPGWDGLVEATAGDSYVPVGRSAWEMATGNDPRAKAQSDYRSRTQDPLGVVPEKTTFVFVTPRIWPQRDDWRSTRRNDGPWLDIRAYDAYDIETWLERAPSIHIWISEHLGRNPRDISTPDRWWDAWSGKTRPVLPRSFLLAGREAAISRLADALAQTTQVITVAGPSREEALAVICACIVRGDENADELSVRTLVVSGADAWDRLLYSDIGLVLIPTFEDPDLQAALSKGHRVVVQVADDVGLPGIEVRIPPIAPRTAAEDVIRTAGLDPITAERYAIHARRSLLSLRRTIAVSPALQSPAWARPPEGKRLVPLLIAGSWRQDSDGDREVIASLTGRPYTTVETDVEGWSALEDAPLRRSGQNLRIVAKDDVWDLISQFVTPTDLARFVDIAIRVFQEPDPALDISLDRRLMAAAVGEPSKYSARLRTGIADTIAFFGGYVGDHRLANGMTGQGYSDHLVGAITKNLDSDPTGRSWRSLVDVMPLLAEASPDRFLDAVEADLADDNPLLRTLFLNSDTAAHLGTSASHIPLIWALESLCWSSNHLRRAAIVLARLADIDPDASGRIQPRPAGSLAQIFNLYQPQTTVTLHRRLMVLDDLRNRSHASSWSLLQAILPAVGVYSPSRRPRWRGWAQRHIDEVNPAEAIAGATEIVNRLVEDAKTNGARWTDLVNRVDTLAPSDRDRILAALEMLAPDSIEDRGKNSVWRALVKLATRHQQHQDSGWAMPGDVIARVENIAARFTPTSLVELYTDVFDHHPRLPGIDPRDSDVYEGELRNARRDAVSAILESGGVADLLALGSAAKVPAAVGWAAAEERGDQLIDGLLPLLGTDGPVGNVAHGYAARCIDLDGLDWIERQLRRSDVTWSTPQQVGLLLAVPRPDQRLLSLVRHRSPEVQEVFWQRLTPFVSDPEARPAIARELTARRRPSAALTVLVGMLPADNHPPEAPIDESLIEKALEHAATGLSDGTQYATSLAWEAERLLDYLESIGSNIETRARLEFLFMPLLQHTRQARALGEALGTQPALFVEIMRIVYRAKDDSTDAPVSPERRALAEVGFSVLRSWHTPPGVRSDGTVNVEQLQDWVSEVRHLLAESDRRAVGDIVIGEVLAYVPSESDGLWPPRPVRDLIENLASGELEIGLQTGKLNSRGIVTRVAMSGGEQERALAAEYRGWADRVADGWPRTAALLRTLAATYDAWGRREDDLADDSAE